MPVVSFTSRDLLRGTVVTPGWYRVKIHSVGEAPASAQPGKTPSTNYPVEASILFDGDTGDTKFANVPIDYNFNSKAIGFAVGFLKAFGADPKEGQRIELKSAEDRELDVFIENDVWQGRTVNRVNHKYRAPKPEVTAKSE